MGIKTVTPTVGIVRTERTVKDVEWWKEMVRGIYKQMVSGIAPPRPEGWQCSPKYCGYWERCRGV